MEPLYINTVINLLTIYETLNELQLTNKFKVDNIIMDFIKSTGRNGRKNAVKKSFNAPCVPSSPALNART